MEGRREVTSRDLKQKRPDFRWIVSTFLQLVVVSQQAARH